MDSDKRQCPYCEKYLSKSYIKRHIKNIHNVKIVTNSKNNKSNTIKKTLNSNSKSKPNTNNKISKITDNELDDLFDIELKLDNLDINRSKTNSNILKSNTGTKEEMVQKKLEKKLGFGHKTTPAGIIDILTNDEIIEIKNWKGWHHAIGQLMVYSYYYPKHMKRIHFFGEFPSQDKMIVIKTICTHHRIKITHEPNKK